MFFRNLYMTKKHVVFGGVITFTFWYKMEDFQNNNKILHENPNREVPYFKFIF